jgi:hypothetical protein
VTARDDLAERVRTGVLSPEQAAAVRASLEASGARMRAAAQAFAEAARPGLVEFEQRVNDLMEAARRSLQGQSEPIPIPWGVVPVTV